MLTPTQSFGEVSGTPNYMVSDGGNNQVPLQYVHHDDPVGRNARIRLDYKKSFQDDLVFFPEPKSVNSSMADTNYMFQRPNHRDQHSNQKENLLLLMALKRQQQHHQQQQFYQNQLAMRKGAVNDTFYQQPLQQEQHFGENYMSPQNFYSYMNLRARG